MLSSFSFKLSFSSWTTCFNSFSFRFASPNSAFCEFTTSLSSVNCSATSSFFSLMSSRSSSCRDASSSVISRPFSNSSISVSLSFSLICKVTTFSSSFSCFWAVSKWFFLSILIFCTKISILPSFASESRFSISNCWIRFRFASSDKAFPLLADCNKDFTWLKSFNSRSNSSHLCVFCRKVCSFCSASNFSDW